MRNYETITLKATRAGVAVIMLNRPERHNAFNDEMVQELADAFDVVREADGLRMLILRGAGKSFSAGADLDWMKAAASNTRGENEMDAQALAEMLRKLHELPQMTLALAHGAAYGGGVGLVACCDVAIALSSAKFRFSEVRLGLTPSTIAPYVIEAIGPRWARALFVTGESFDGDYAERMGLVQYSVADEEEMARMEEYISSLVFDAAPGAVSECKKLVREVTGAPIDNALGHATARHIAARRASDEGREGIAAFLEKRKPDWAG